LKNTLSILSGILFFAGFIPYIVSILKGVAKPSKASWIVWCALDAVTIAGMLAKHSITGQIVGAFVGSCALVVLSLKYGKSGWTRIDKGCLVGGALGILLWAAFRDADYGIVVSMSVVLIGTIPTIISAWQNPANEDRTAWTIFFLSCMPAMAAIPAWTWADALQPSVYLTGDTVMVFILYARPSLLAKATQPRTTP